MNKVQRLFLRKALASDRRMTKGDRDFLFELEKFDKKHPDEEISFSQNKRLNEIKRKVH